MSELSLVELDDELVAELPTRNLLRRHRARASARASFGSAAASNATYQINFNPQVVVNNGQIDGPVSIISHNTNFNNTTQNLTPVNILGGLLG